MNTRQQYKMVALQGICTTSAGPLLTMNKQDIEMVVKTAGQIADAMIEEDKKSDKGMEPFPAIKKGAGYESS